MHPDPSVQGATQKVSAIRHFLALDRFYKIHGRDCDTRNKEDKDEFVQLVGLTSNVCPGLYTTNFYYPLKKHDGDFCVGSNFYSAGQVKVSLAKPDGEFEYPQRGKYPLLKIKNGVLIRDVSLYKNFSYYLSGADYYIALIIWLLRDQSIQQIDGATSYQMFQAALSNLFTDELVAMLIGKPDGTEEITKKYTITLETESAKISNEDVFQIFENDFKGKQRYQSDSYQQIYYGAPGTGKSHRVKEETDYWNKKGRVVRTTFHPDSDYSTFVGCYKPSMDNMPLRNNLGQIIGKDGKYISVNQEYNIEDVVTEKKITYDFVPQAFLQAYIDAWKNRDEPEFLIIEEINRGNCAQIFGDLFQLLDRGDDGYSDYAIRADKDLKSILCKEFEKTEIEDYPRVKDGTELVLPDNLYIRATMNTSDQSLFPIDSAFKRRWDWKYVPIAQGVDENGNLLKWKIGIDGDKYDWWDFLNKINRIVSGLTNSEDKQLGYFFCKAKDRQISAETFVGKVIFYLWNDVFKDFGFDDAIFKDEDDEDNPKLSFDKFFKSGGDVNDDTIIKFFDNLGLEASTDESEENDEEEDDDKGGNDYTKYQINGNGVALAKKQVATELIQLYIQKNPSLSAQQVVKDWNSLGKLVSHFVETEDEFAKRKDTPRVNKLTCNGENIYVSTNGWGGKKKMQQLKDAVESKDWGLSFDEI